MMFAILCTQGEMTARELFKECKENKFAPILIMRNEEGTIVPIFHNQDTAHKFTKRNVPKEWAIFGAVQLTPRDCEWMEMKGWKFCLLDFPRKLKDVVDFDVEILEYDEVPDVFAHRI